MDITPGHWIFAGLFLISFILILAWSFLKDKKVNSRQFGNVGLVALIIGGSIIMLIIIKFALRNINQ
jgi:uncharacterized membrane protein